MVRRQPAKKSTKRKVPSRGSSKFMRPLKLSPALAACVGKGPMPRTEVTKKIWDYIKKHKCQDPDSPRMIVPDEKLAKVFGSRRRIDMFAMPGKISTHLTS